MTRTGKIARLPREIREELNRRLSENEPGGSLLGWLNDLPALKDILARQFGGAALTKQNLYEWRLGGFAEWQARREIIEDTRELAADAKEVNTAGGKITDHLATALAARYAAVLAAGRDGLNDASRRQLRLLHSLSRDIVELRRGDHSGARLRLKEEERESEREKTEAEVFEHFESWLKNVAMQDVVRRNWTNARRRRRELRKVFSLPPEAPEQTSTVSPESDSPTPG
jgi:hypothetical protein